MTTQAKHLGSLSGASMDTFQYIIFALTFVNLFVFIVMGRFFFDVSVGGHSFWSFAGVFMILTGVALGSLYSFRTQDPSRLVGADFLLGQLSTHLLVSSLRYEACTIHSSV
jgi:hypothetical protein